MVRRAVHVEGITELVLTNLDVLAGLDEVQVITGYRVGGRTVDAYPVRLRDAAAAVPVLERLPGWPEQDWPEVARRGADAIPDAARRYVDRLASLLDVEIVAVGVGPDRRDTVPLSETSLLTKR